MKSEQQIGERRGLFQTKFFSLQFCIFEKLKGKGRSLHHPSLFSIEVSSSCCSFTLLVRFPPSSVGYTKGLESFFPDFHPTQRKLSFGYDAKWRVKTPFVSKYVALGSYFFANSLEADMNNVSQAQDTRTHVQSQVRSNVFNPGGEGPQSNFLALNDRGCWRNVDFHWRPTVSVMPCECVLILDPSCAFAIGDETSFFG